MSKAPASGIFLLKCVAFSLIFLAVWIIGYWPLSDALHTADRLTEEWEARADEYDSQARRIDKQIVEAEVQQRRMAALLTSQEAQNVRYEAVLQMWEKQTGLRK